MLSVNDMQSINNSENCSVVRKEEPIKTSKHDELQYLDLIQNILDNGTRKEDRTGKINTFSTMSKTWMSMLYSIKSKIFI